MVKVRLVRKQSDIYEMKKVDTYYWFGTDSLGRDMFSRLWKGTQISFTLHSLQLSLM